MRITKYSLFLEDGVPSVVKENSCNYPKEKTLNDPGKIVAMMNELFHLSQRAEEFIYILAMDSAFKCLGVFEVSHGVVDGAVFSPREIFIRALLVGAKHVVMLHNHPSGGISPSKDDMCACQRVLDAGKLIGIPLADNIIVGEHNTFCSFKDQGLL